ncbi:uncharacterized protein PRCAT00005963001 [Priceomyces carsonii]|uniref:uncharacterized protein n=1 Tax=Priceomyces carsonii TaxID=28549 RepID=UPI002EDBA8E3|nr:unnamed protein product [Priceomyces carsonii]
MKRPSDTRALDLRIASYDESPSLVVGSFFNGISIPPESDFNLYKHKKSNDYILHGENNSLDYNGETDNKDDSEYFVAIYDPVHKSVDLQKAPFVRGHILSKSKRSYKGPAVKQAGIKNYLQRNALGEAFGTKKARAAITNIERNRIDSEKLQDAELDIVENVKESTQDIPTGAEMQQVVSNDRPTPAANVDATNVEDIYPLQNIIPEKEWSLLRVNPILNEDDEKKRLELLPYNKSIYISKRIPKLVDRKDTEKLKVAYYTSLLFGVYENRRVKDKQTLMDRLQNKPSEVLIDGILERFAVQRATQFGKSKDRSFVIDPQHEDKLLCYLVALTLHIDDFAVELPPLAHELNIKPTKLVSICKTLGATVKSATAAQAEAFGIPKITASTYKVATLKVPFKLPELTRKTRR